jgi:chloramphenicol 3-O phosphotransferase
LIIFLNGASSAGKSSIVRELQSRWNGPLIYLSLDAVISQMPFQYTGDGALSEKGFPLIQQKVNGKTCVKAMSGEYGYKLNEIYALHAKATVEAGFDVVIDYVLLDKEMLSPFKYAFIDLEVCFVGVRCDSEELNRRNLMREDRIDGLSVAQDNTIHFCQNAYDLTVNSTNDYAGLLSQIIMDHVSEKTIGHGISF